MDQKRRFNQPTHTLKKAYDEAIAQKAYIRGKEGKPIWWHMLSTDWNITRH
jgi:hypothetical protein